MVAAATFVVSLGQQPTFMKVDAPGYHILVRVGGCEVDVDKNTSTIIPIVSSFGDIGREGNSSSIDDYIFSLWELESLNGFTRLPIHRFMSYPPSVDKSSVPFVVWTQQEMSCGEGVRTIELRFIDRHSSDDCIDL